MVFGDDNKRYTAACVQGGHPPCACVCPFNFDIKSFLLKIKAGKFDAAYRDYANKVIFPAIVSEICDARCGGSCPEQIALKALERATVRHTADRSPLRFNLPPRKGGIAIVGGGLSGLACAHKLAVKKYPVTLFERTGQIGGSLKTAMAEEKYLAEFALQFEGIIHTRVMDREIWSLDELAAFTAVYIATGENGNHFGLKDGWNPQSLSTVREGVFLGGRLTGGNPMDALAQGIMAAISIERYMRIQDMQGQPESFYIHDCALPPFERKENARPVEPADRLVYLKEEAAQEAERCALCDCTRCFDTCPFMQELSYLPRRVEAEAMGARHTDGLMGRIGTRMIASCTLCGHCEAVCDFDVSLEQLLRFGKIVLHEQGAFAPPYHDFYLRDMDFMMGDAYLAEAPPKKKNAGYLLFPGCQIAASSPQYVEQAYAYMLERHPDTALMLACCGVPALYAGQAERMSKVHDTIRTEWERMGKPTLVAACATCMKTFAEFLPEIPMMSLFEYISVNGLPSGHTALEGRWAVFDPCSSRKFPGMQEAVRILAEKLGAELEELPESGPRASCCGMGGHIYAANPELSHKFLQRAANQSPLPYLAYCANCRNLFNGAGKSAVHILDAVFGVKPMFRQPHISEGRRNRLAVKILLRNKYWEEMERHEMLDQRREYTLNISEELYKKMDAQLVSEEDVYAVVENAMKGQSAVYNEETDSYFAHLLVGIITYWVEFRTSEEGFRVVELLNAYCHRVIIS